MKPEAETINVVNNYNVTLSKPLLNADKLFKQYRIPALQ
jgi:hypothetical protein